MSIQNEIDRIQSGVDDIKAAIAEKGGTVADGAKVDQLGAAVRSIPVGINADAAFPIGRVVTFYDDEDHSNWLGFTWVRCLQNRFPVGYGPGDGDFGTIGKTGGERTHALTDSEVPPLRSRDLLASSGGSNGRVEGYNGNGGPHNNLPPYEVISYWRRTR